MRIIVMFDLPTLTSGDRRNYRQFRKHLINDGFIMMQESIYTCILIDRQSADLLEKKISLYAPKNGLIQTMIVTEKQYTSINFITGKSKDNIDDKFERLTVI
ncbi:CRISPR-associated endonuclease Cas2 [Companilactobacillus mishanensis]|uniref:CRISPR-associated endoribonuclease Cas2 n=1 Tax=Companilactobacillus mishanensis TaxID=2486008 RepID=A0A5P0ZK83_9LACO|nr:CRISPR-associated endonuclease Cas2 [Companilactobacillus mishanensis]MQS53510.1 CRISPR-associated endonuclease Cas2 [Companilactobacillus mishanensis]MQS90116.1 CRISPR-associated endonuclease Cas2 [Companilactobacillus mishanensis]